MPCTGFPASHERYEPAVKEKTRKFTLLAGIRADGTAVIAFPSACQGHSVAVMKLNTLLK